MIRAFSGPVGRPRNVIGNRQHPVDIDHLYLVTNDGPWVYEAGFSFPYTQYFRSQVLQTEKGLVALVARLEDKEIFEKIHIFLEITERNRTNTTIERRKNQKVSNNVFKVVR